MTAKVKLSFFCSILVYLLTATGPVSAATGDSGQWGGVNWVCFTLANDLGGHGGYWQSGCTAYSPNANQYSIFALVANEQQALQCDGSFLHWSNLEGTD
jgi:hypothetical protein